MHTLTVSKDVSHYSAPSSHTRLVWTHLSFFLLFKYKWTTMQVHLNCIKLKETEFQTRHPVRKFNHIERHYIALARFSSPSIPSSSQSTLWPKSLTEIQNQFWLNSWVSTRKKRPISWLVDLNKNIHILIPGDISHGKKLLRKCWMKRGSLKTSQELRKLPDTSNLESQV